MGDNIMTSVLKFLLFPVLVHSSPGMFPAPSFDFSRAPNLLSGLPSSTSNYRPSYSDVPTKSGFNFANRHEMSQAPLGQLQQNNPFPQYAQFQNQPQAQFNQMRPAAGQSSNQGFNFDPVRPSLASLPTKQGINFANSDFSTGHNFSAYQQNLYPGFSPVGDHEITASSPFRSMPAPAATSTSIGQNQQQQQQQQFLPSGSNMVSKQFV